ncbi:hypothetical protein [Pedobacter terrae]|uniref:hypothetical protein n=1 Tax=Pedobacter terrae TaxID=405671 RepID=UPI002FFB0190
MSLIDVAGMMNTSLGTANSWAQASAIAAKLEVAAQFATAGKIFGYLDVASNVLEITDSKQSMLQNVEDGGQAVLGVALIFAGGPVTIVAGGIILAAWELWEYKRDN